MKYLVVGDFHIPARAEKIPHQILDLGKEVDEIVCTGDLTSKKVLDELKGANKNPIVVKGNCDFLNLPRYREFEDGNRKVGVIHSDTFGRGNLETLKEFANRKNLDVLIFGHTHKPLVKKEGKLLLLNPGTATGVLSGAGGKTEKTYAILEINEEVNAEIKKVE